MKLFRVKIRMKNVVITVATVFFVFGMFVCKAFTSMVTKNEIFISLKLFILFTKLMVFFLHDGISFTRGWRWWSTKRKISEVWQLMMLLTGLPGLCSLFILGVILNFGVFGFITFRPSAVFLENRFSFLNWSSALFTILFYCAVKPSLFEVFCDCFDWIIGD